MHFNSVSRRALLTLAAAGVLAAAVPAVAQEPEAKEPEAKEPVANEPVKAAVPARIGIIGAGNIGGTLGSFWAKAGHAVMLSSRHPEELKTLVEGLGPRVRAGTPAEAIAFGDVVVVAVPYKAYPQLARDYAAAWAGKVVIDAGNATQARDGEVYGEVQAQGIAAVSAKYLAGARIVRAFNFANYKVFAKNAHRDGGRMGIPLAGDDPQALATVSRLVEEAGFDPVVVGPLTKADSFAMGSPGFGLEITGPELRSRLGVAR